jgi:hypothetical protein
MQAFKTVYFPEARPSGKRGITLAFGEGDALLYERVAYLSSMRVRELLGYRTLAELEADARQRGEPLTTVCRLALKEALEGTASTRPFADGLQATFTGGRDQPLQNWYPYLEGYSPDFVREILATYAPKAKHVLDPFAGSGTTPLTVMGTGGVGYYSDVNPLCTFLIATKAEIRKAPPEDLPRIAETLHEFRRRLGTNLGRARPDADLRATYELVFGKSEFFDAAQRQEVLQARTLIDGMPCPRARALATVAAIRSLIPASRLIRRGDLRFKNGSELARGTPTFADAFAQSLDLIIGDVAHLEPVSGAVVRVGESALETNYTHKYDSVVTSPPYLNGTNYFRNTKVELWFLRRLRTKAELRGYRHRAVTAGINDVTREKTSARRGSYDSKLLVHTVNSISASAYDPRIPDMVETYFNDMHGALSRLWRAISAGGTLAIDIGDSTYAGVHVPTDRVLSEMVRDLGGEPVDDVTLRERASRDGGRLRQCLLVFRKQ